MHSLAAFIRNDAGIGGRSFILNHVLNLVVAIDDRHFLEVKLVLGYGSCFVTEDVPEFS